MQGKKELLSAWMMRTKALRLIERLRKDVLVIFGYHRILPRAGFVAPYAEDVYGPTPEEFEEAVVWLKEHVHLLSEEELLYSLDKDVSPRRLSVLLSFDDGYKDNYELAYPILKRHGVPAVFFIPSRMIDERLLGWWDLAAYFLKQTPVAELSWDGRTFRLPAERDAATRFFHRTFQLEKHERTKDLVEELSELTLVPMPDPAARDKELMSWAELREVADNGIAVRSHTHSHHVLATLPVEVQRDELRTSKAVLEERLGQKVRSLAYPVGGYQHFTADTRRLAWECGYDLGYSFCTGVNRFGHILRYDVKRIGPPSSLPLLAGTTVLPEVFDWDTPSGYGG